MAAVRKTILNNQNFVVPGGVGLMRVTLMDRPPSPAMASGNFSQVFLPSGLMFNWGQDSKGQLGRTFNGAFDNHDRSYPYIHPKWNGTQPGGFFSGLADLSIVQFCDGQNFVYGLNSNGNQMGDPSFVAYSYPVAVLGMQGFRVFAMGTQTMYGIDSTGVLKAWGGGGSGRLGNGTPTGDVSSPVVVSGGFNWMTVGAGENAGYGIDSSLILRAWGDNSQGQLGDGTLANKSTPTAVGGALRFVKVAAGQYFAAAISTSGDLYTMGYNASGQLGDGTVVNKSTPTLVIGGHKFIDVKAGQEHVLALRADGLVMTFGANNNCALGDGTLINKSSPVAVAGSPKAAFISAGYKHNLIVDSQGRVLTWGLNASGQVGDNTIDNKSSPVVITGLGETLSTSPARVVKSEVVDVIPGSSYAVVVGSRSCSFGDILLGKASQGYIILEYNG